MAGQVEAERKYELAPGQGLPSLAGVLTEGPVAEFDLEATYYDTPDFRLAGARQMVRRRTGGHDAGWHLKLPGGRSDERVEFGFPPAARVPAELRERVAGTLAGAPLVPVAVLRTRRREQQLLGPGGELLALSCLDRVLALAAGQVQEWSEAEIELAGGPPDLLDTIEAVLLRAGLRPAASPSKAARALAPAMAARAVAEREPSAGAVVLAYLAEQVGVLQDREAAVLVDAPDAVHRSRVATRRLRSALRTYARVFTRGAGKPLRAELRWHAEELGAPRDAEVLKERLLAALGELDPVARGQVGRRIEHALEATHAAAHAELVATMRTARYEALQLSLERLLAEPSFDRVAGLPATTVLPPLHRAAVARVRQLVGHATARPSDLTRWHEVRKAAKAARYGAELLLPVLGDRAERSRAAWEAVTEALGAVQDAVVAQRVLGDLAWAAVAEGEFRLPFDDLRHGQDARLREALAAGRTALTAALDLEGG